MRRRRKVGPLSRHVYDYRWAYEGGDARRVEIPRVGDARAVKRRLESEHQAVASFGGPGGVLQRESRDDVPGLAERKSGALSDDGRGGDLR